jgi:TM2 domain-containing membrane protein YozV/RNA polymerase subunit RPABC4/transcription elongation factor Spt4
MYCFACGEIIKIEAEICPKCGVRQNASRSMVGSPEVYCKSCGEQIKREAEICPKCGVRQFNELNTNNNSSKKQSLNGEWLTLLLLWFFLGAISAHTFYAGKVSKGILRLVIFLISIPLCSVYIGIAGFVVIAIWQIIDLINILSEKYENQEGKIYYRAI